MATAITSSFIRCQYVAKDNEEECQEEQYLVSQLFVLFSPQ